MCYLAICSTSLYFFPNLHLLCSQIIYPVSLELWVMLSHQRLFFLIHSYFLQYVICFIFLWLHLWFIQTFFFWLHHEACRILVPWPRFKPMSPVVKIQCPNRWTAMKVHRFYFCIYPALIFLLPKWSCPSIPSQIAYIIPIGLKYHFIILRILTCNLVSSGTQFCPVDLTFSCLDTFIHLLTFSFQICPSRYILSIPVVRKNFQKHSLTVLCHCLKLTIYVCMGKKKAKWSSVYRLICSNTAQLTTFCHNGSWQAMPLLEFHSFFFFLLWPHPTACRILVFNQRLNPGPGS